MTSSYFNQLLDEVTKERYLDKLTYNNIVLPDPLDETIRPYTFSPNVNIWPPVVFGDLYIYLVTNVCFYTQEEIRNFKALDSYNYFYSGKVKNIVTYRNNAINICVLTCDVQASQTLKKLHRPWVITSTNGVVRSAHCTCMAGLGEACSHVAALLFALEVATKEGPPSSTSVSCTWNKCSKKVDPQAIVDIMFNHNRKDVYKKPCVEFEMPSTSAFNAFLEVIKKNSPDAPILKMMSDEEDTSTASETEKIEIEWRKQEEKGKEEGLKANIQNLLQYYTELNKRIPITIKIAQKIDFFLENSVFSTAYITNVERLTRAQHRSALWAHCRQGRVTASKFGRILRSTNRGRKNLIDSILNHSAYCNSAMEYGQMAEELAKDKLKKLLDERHDNVEILPAGFLIDQQYGFMGASPDGIIICNCCDCDTALLEIKSCYKGRDLLIKDINKKNFFLDERKNLKRNHKYFDQVQGQMDIWNISKCYFVTYTDVDIHWEEIYYDSEFWTPRKSNLINFFKQYVLPEIIKHF